MFDSSQSDRPILTAEGARALTKKRTTLKNHNFDITLRRIYKMIEVRAKEGHEEMRYTVSSFVLDGTICDPIMLAHQLQKKLCSIGYEVVREDSTLFIAWHATEIKPQIQRRR